MLSDDELRRRLLDLEADNVERTRAAQESRKLREAICAFANDMPDRREVGLLLIGAEDDGRCANLVITDAMLRNIEAFGRDGTVVPLPSLTVRAVEIDACRMIAVEVQPSDNPPVKYDGRVCVRRGPVRGYATPEEERRLTEKRRWGNLPFDQQPVPGTSINDLDMRRFQIEYLPSAVAPDVLAENGRAPEEQLRALRFLAPDGRVTAAGLIVLGKEPRAWLPGAYVQFVRYPGDVVGETVQDQKEVGGPLVQQLSFLDEIIAANVELHANLSGTQQDTRPTYPAVAVQELLRNAIIHRNYEGTATPVRMTWYDDRIEITSPGGPYGEVTAENFGRPGATAYRNPAIAEAAKVLGYMQRFGSGIPRAREALKCNGNPPPEFSVEPQFVHVTIRTAA